jgi:hypothetical protein
MIYRLTYIYPKFFKATATDHRQDSLRWIDFPSHSTLPRRRVCIARTPPGGSFSTFTTPEDRLEAVALAGICAVMRQLAELMSHTCGIFDELQGEVRAILPLGALYFHQGREIGCLSSTALYLPGVNI